MFAPAGNVGFGTGHGEAKAKDLHNLQNEAFVRERLEAVNPLVWSLFSSNLVTN